MSDAATRLERVRRRGRRIGLGVFVVIVSSFTVVCAVQIIVQVWFSPRPAAAEDCRPGVRRLLDSLYRARRATEREPGERAALDRFRAHLHRPWSARPALSRACRDDPEALAALEAIVQLRYAEERAVRYHTRELTGLRVSAEALTARLSADE